METCDERWRINPIPFLAIAIISRMCLAKVNLQSDTIPRCLWSFAEATIWSLKWRGGCASRLLFLEKSNYIACLFGSGLKNIFHCCAHDSLSIRSWFNSDADTLGSVTIENNDVLSAKNLIYVNEK